MVISNFFRPGRALDRLSRFFSSMAVTALSRSRVGAEFGFVVFDKPCQVSRDRGGVGQQFADGVAAFHQHRQQIVGVENERVHLLASLGEYLSDGCGVVQQVCQRLAAAVQ